ncbi:MAG: hypothetical protein IV104_13010 [Acidovorax sp.]|nr:hypothetical protein [Acidovorax sp.]
MAAIKKDPDATLDYTVDWSDWLAPLADVIVSVEWVSSAGITVESSTNTSATATAFVSGGVVDADEFVTCRITTSGGRIDDRTIYFSITQR